MAQSIAFKGCKAISSNLIVTCPSVYSVISASSLGVSRSIQECSFWGSFSNFPTSSVTLSQYLQCPTTLPCPFKLPSIPSHLSLTSGFVLILDLAVSSMICRSNGIRPRITSMVSVGVDLSAPEIAIKVFAFASAYFQVLFLIQVPFPCRWCPLSPTWGSGHLSPSQQSEEVPSSYTRGRQPMAREPDVALLMAASGSQPKF